MFSSLISGRRKSASVGRARVTQTRLSVESLEDRTVPSTGPGGGSGLITGTPGGSGTAVIQTSTSGSTPGGSGSTSGGSGGSLFLSGPAYPLAPTSGPAPTDAGSPPTSTLVPMCGTTGPS